MRTTSTAGVVWRTCLIVCLLSLFVWLVLGLANGGKDFVAVTRILCLVTAPAGFFFLIIDYGWRQFLREFPESIRISLVLAGPNVPDGARAASEPMTLPCTN